jgi:AcrR family transcriptional regulator
MSLARDPQPDAPHRNDHHPVVRSPVGHHPVAIDGRALGSRGTRTRRRLLDATATLLETHGIRDLRVVDIARQVETSPATFYQCFRDVEGAVLVLASEVGEATAALLDGLAGSWDGDDTLESARTLVERFVEFWDRNRAVLRTRNLAAQEGDPRFRDVRNRALGPVTEALADHVRAGQQAGRVAPEISADAAGAALVALLERMAAFHRDLEPLGINRTDLVETTARIIHQTVAGR